MNERIEELEAAVAADDFARRPAVAQADTLNELAWEIKYADAKRARQLSLRARRLSEDAAYTKGLAYALRNASACGYLLADYREGLGEALGALRLFEETRDDAGRAHALTVAGNIRERLGDHREALELHRQSLEVREQLGDREGASTSLNNLGNVYVSFGEYAAALSHYLKSLTLYEAVGSREGEGRALNNIGGVYRRLGESDKALDYFSRALAIKKQIGDRQNVGLVLFNLGGLYESEGDTARALEYYFESLESARAAGDRQSEAACLGHIGNVFRSRGETENALEFYAKSLEITLAAGIRYYETEVRISLGETHAAAGEGERALEHLLRALAVAEELDSHELIYRAHRALSEAYEKTCDTRAALAHYKKFHDARERVYGEDAAKKIKRVVIRAEVERAEREAEIYRLRNVELARATEELRRANDEKGALVARLREKSDALERETREDFLTGLLNRRHADLLLAREFSRARRFRRDFAVVMVDVDNFKEINDRFSHHAGDEVLKALASILKSNCREIDLVARYGGEEFVLGLIETPAAKAAVLCEKLRARIEAHDWHAISHGLKVTASFGICDDLSHEDCHAMLRAADAKLYEAKRGGRNQVRH